MLRFDDLAYRTPSTPFRYASVSLGAVTMLSSVLSSPLSATKLGVGGTERWVAYPVALWLIAYGGHLLGNSTPDKNG